MSWWLLAFCSAALLGGYDSFKKISLKDNAVIPVLLLNTAISAAIFSPFLFETGWGGWAVQKFIVLKSALVLSSWIAGYYAMKHLPLTIVGPVNATRPVLVLLGAIFLFGEKLNALQWGGVILAMVAYLLMRISGRKEGIRTGNKWLVCLILAVILGAASGLYDKYLMSPQWLGLDRKQVLAWYTLYQAGMMALVTAFLWYPVRKKTTPFHWNWAI
ncbi:MAG: DMT family transporter, partial [Bacteroidales bacterium]|nr:DMT family transporter [Bacteroidales bacterium]